MGGFTRGIFGVVYRWMASFAGAPPPATSVYIDLDAEATGTLDLEADTTGTINLEADAGDAILNFAAEE